MHCWLYQVFDIGTEDVPMSKTVPKLEMVTKPHIIDIHYDSFPPNGENAIIPIMPSENVTDDFSPPKHKVIKY